MERRGNDMNHIFVSYSHKDKDIVSGVVTVLRQEDMDVWQDDLGKSSGIPRSTKWREVIENALYSASGAIIFDTEKWHKSPNCIEEFDIITKNSIPYLRVFPAVDTDTSDIVSDILQWYNYSVGIEENKVRTWLFSEAYSFQQSKNRYHLIPRMKKIREAIDYLSELRDYRDQVDEERYAEKNPEIGKAISRLLKSARQRTVISLLTKIFFWVLVVSVVFFGYIISRVFPEMLEKSNTRGTTDAAMGVVYDTAEYDPIAAMSLLSMPELYDPHLVFVMQQLMVELDSVHLPVSFYPAASHEAAGYRSLPAAKTNSRFTVDISSTNGKVYILDLKLNTTKQLLLSCRPSDYCFSSDNRYLAVAAANKAAVYDLHGSLFPVALSYNFEDIQQIGFADNQVFVVTVTGNVVIWDNPITPKIHSRNLNEGSVFSGDNGYACAVYIDGTDLIYNNNNIEKIIPLSVDGKFDLHQITVSHDHRLAAAAYSTNDSDVDYILVLDLINERIISDYSAESVIGDLVFSLDDKTIVAACYDGKGIVKIGLMSGEIEFSNPSGFQNFTITTYRDMYLVTDINGWMMKYSAELGQIGDLFRVIPISVPAKQLAVSEKYGVAFTANRGGNTFTGCARTGLSSGRQDLFILPADQTMFSNTSVTVSHDGNYVAFGYPSGQVRVFEVRCMSMLWKNDSIAESVCALSFSGDDKSIHALGASGTLYTLKAENLAVVPEEDQLTAYWQGYIDKAVDKHQSMYALGLTYITPDSFILG